MGQFSWLDCKSGEQVLDDVRRDVYVLVPQEFGGGHIKEDCYDGYGHFGGFDIFDLVAIWNRNYVDSSNIKRPQRDSFTDDDDGQRYYESALIRYGGSVQRLIAFKNGEVDMSSTPKWLREIGIDLACYDEDNARLKYPIKITHDPDAVYEDCDPSNSDPNQGWQV